MTLRSDLSKPIHLLRGEAKKLSRAESIPLNQALDQIAKVEGYQKWSHLMAVANETPESLEQLSRFICQGDLVLLASRPRLGKTRLAVNLSLMKAALSQSKAYLYSLDFTPEEFEACVAASRSGELETEVQYQIDCSDEISAEYICRDLEARAQAGDIVLIDYLQRLDEKRSNAELELQVQALHDFARSKRLSIIFLCQLDRYHQSTEPKQSDLRLPNPLDLNWFNKILIMTPEAIDKSHDLKLHLLKPKQSVFSLNRSAFVA